MNMARPASGFVLRERPAVKQTLNDRRHDCPWLDRIYADAVARLRMSGHKEGRVSELNATVRSVVELDPQSGQKRLGVSYQVSADVLTIRAIRVLIASGEPDPS